MRLFVALLLYFTFVLKMDAQVSYLQSQKRYSRVRIALSEKNKLILQKLKKNNIDIKQLQILLVAYKEEGELELWARNKQDKKFKRLKTFAICSKSGNLGPKRKEGDLQVPEGFYFIEKFNPASSFYLSLGINYPNSSDKIKSDKQNPGSEIYIHGSCATIGCIPITDDLIKELYLYAIYGKNYGQQKIPVYIFPFKMTETNIQKMSEKYKDNKEVLNFWKNLQLGYNEFNKHQDILDFKLDALGDYVFE